MKRILAILLLICTFCLSGCNIKQDVDLMFDSFEKSANIVLLTRFELVVNTSHYDLDEIKYNGKQCNIVFLEESGFYSYTYDQEDLSVDILYTSYDNFETICYGTEILPSRIINAFFADNRFWFRMDDPDTDEFQQTYYSWSVDTKQKDIVDSVSDDYEYSEDNNRSERYSFAYTSKLFGDCLEITDNETGITKRIDSSVLNTFEEGKQIKKARSSTAFGIQQVFEDNGNIYFASFFGVNFLGDPCYCYVYKWNFETENCEFYTFVRFETFQEWVTDMYIKTN